MAHLLRAYNALLIRRPVISQCITAGVLFGAGDIIAQQAVEGRGKDHDFIRTGRITFYGGCLFGPAMSQWYGFLNRLTFASPTRALIYRVWLDQAILTPGAVAFFYGAMSVLEGKPQEAIQRIQTAYVPTLIRNWAVYIPTQIINFSIVPPHLRLVVVSIVSLFWNTYLSAANAAAQKVQAAQPKKVKQDLNTVD